MANNSTAVSNVIPFSFGKQQVRTLLIDDQPWFVAGDVASALEYRIAGDMTRNLDEDEKGTQIVRTLGGDQEMLVINESGLYSAILRSRKAEAKRFKKWVTAEVLPAIRKHGRYEDSGDKMATLMDQLSLSQFNTIKGVIRDKIKAAPAEKRQGLQLVMHNRLHTRFNVPRTELIPAGEFDSACNFIAAYTIEGEFLPKPEKVEGGIYLSRHETHHLYLLMSRFFLAGAERGRLHAAAIALDSEPLKKVWGQLHEGISSFAALDKRRAEIYGEYCALGVTGGYAMLEVAA